MSIFIIGLPTVLRSRLLARAQQNQVRIGFALAAPNGFGVLSFVPYDKQARADLDAYSDGVEWSELQIIQLPYLSLGPDLFDTVELLRAGGASVFVPQPGKGHWPAVEPTGRYGGNFNDDAFAALLEHLGWEARATPSERFRRAATRYPDYLIMHGALDLCDQIERVRHRFLYRSGDALEEFCRKRGVINKPLVAFFEEKGIDFASTGGIKTTLRFIHNNRQLGSPLEEHLHLKDGDATTPQAAARIYFQYLNREGRFKLVLFYVGPHPDVDIDRSIPWEPLER